MDKKKTDYYLSLFFLLCNRVPRHTVNQRKTIKVIKKKCKGVVMLAFMCQLDWVIVCAKFCWHSGCVCWRTQKWLRIEDVKDSRWRPAKWRDTSLPQWVGRVLFQHPRSSFREVKSPGTIVIESTEAHF